MPAERRAEGARRAVPDPLGDLGDADVLAAQEIPEPYAPFAKQIFASFGQLAAMTTESDVAEGVWRAVNDASGTLRFPAGPDALALAQARPAL